MCARRLTNLLCRRADLEVDRPGHEQASLSRDPEHRAVDASVEVAFLAFSLSQHTSVEEVCAWAQTATKLHDHLKYRPSCDLLDRLLSDR